ncbi:methylmalonyl Co-A mutase-associated GTPase MeaB [Zobellia alginiliquefaciens]|uniref:methylmalonyl Co-A mutase-associated GTPase MeaB n=1 Tax=Zobellia alginiliquefaciens TaxID=3032586 RepID=UPI0023E447BC|nr:methylmalonyl Co-A mutase-associated GTPase MeaB [Zobellia alginiliquefaciens]
MNNSKNTDKKGISEIQKKRKNPLVATKLVNALCNGDKTALGQAITLIESNHTKHAAKANEVVSLCLKKQSKSIRIGVTGVPGVGKSTFIETFGQLLTSQGNKVAVLTVDPTSSQSKGSILGDKTRMETLAKDPNAFIRPSPSGLSLGGVTRKTRESIILCEAAGYSIILIETVGVGQNETTVHGMVDFFLLLKLAGAGDELQGIKRGIIEMADSIVINKADGNNIANAKIAKNEFENSLKLYPPKENGWRPKVLYCSATENTGVEEVWSTIAEYIKEAKETGFFEDRRKQQNKNWLYDAIEQRLKSDFYTNTQVRSEIDEFLKQIATKEISPFLAADKLIAVFKSRS